MLIVNGITYTDDVAKANALNEVFVSQSAQMTDDSSQTIFRSLKMLAQK